MTNPLEPFVGRRGAAVLDGGLATELEARGLELDDPLWSARALIVAPETIARVHRDYLEAGADVITTATYQATLPGLVARGLSEARARETLASGVTLARAERDRFWEARFAREAALRPLVAASIGSYGAFLADGSEYRGDYGLDRESLAVWHRSRLHVLEESGADLLAFETIPSLVEVEAIAALLAERDGLPAWISFQARDASRLADGSPIESAAAIAERSPRTIAVGVNCVAPTMVAALLTNLARATAKPLAAYPNRGDAWDATSRRWIDRPSEIDFAALAREWRTLGARLIGGCCRTRPEDIRTIVASL